MMKKITSLTIALLLVAGVFGATTASAATVAELQAMIAQLTAQLSALSGGTTTSTGTTFTTDMTVGARGAQVSALQEALNTEVGAGLPVTGYFGAMTKAAVIKYQTANGLPGTGFVGPMTRAALNALKTPTVPPTTGTGTGTTGTTLSGGAGSVSEYTLVSSVSNEDVGEDEKDVPVIALDVEADDNSDLQLTAVRVVFNEGTATSDFDQYAEDVSVWVGGKEYARVDADVFTDDNSWTKTLSLSSGAIIKSGDDARIEIKVSGISNLDTNDAGDTWTADISQVRFVDASGASTSEDPSTATRTFTFTTFATAADVELKISGGDTAINEARVIDIDATNDTDNVDLLSFKMKAEGDSDIRITKMPVTLTATGVTNISQIVNTLYLVKDGEEVASETVTASTTSDTVTFDDVDFTIEAGETANFVVRGKVEDTEGTFGNGDTLAVSFGEANTDMTDFVAKDETKTALADGDKTGSATGNGHAMFTSGIKVTLVGTPSTSVLGNDTADADTGTFVIKYRVEAFDGDAYVSANAGATAITTAFPDAFLTNNTNGGVVYYVDNEGTATIAGVTATVDETDVTGDVTAASTMTNGWFIEDGEVAEFTLTITRTNQGQPLDDGQFKAVLKGIGWGAADDQTLEYIYNYNMTNFKTGNVYLN